VTTFAHKPATVPAHSPRGGEIRALTGLRIIAAGWVMLVHFGAFLGPYYDQVPWLRPLLGSGWIGVELFFVLSGYLLTRGYLDEVGGRPTPRVVGRFLLNRFARVWPAWAVVTVLMAAWLVAVRATGRTPDVYTAHPAVTPLSFLQQITMTQMWGRHSMLVASYVPQGWSISAEWTAYLAFPLLAVVLRPLRRLHPVVNLVLAYAAISPLAIQAYEMGPLDANQSWVLRISCGFVAGMFVALALKDVRRTERLDSIGLTLTCASLFLLVMLCYWATWRRGDQLADFSQVAVIAYPGLIAGLVLTTRGPARLLSLPSLVYGGRISYCVYLVHYLVLDVVFAVLWQNPAARWVMTPKVTLLMPVLMLGALVASAMLYHWVEEPSRRLILRFAAHPRLRRTGGTSPVRPVSVLPVPVPVPAVERTARLASAVPPADSAARAAASGI
jgi:peptidoglycan/LPS O-acetylase OafA/YrhL